MGVELGGLVVDPEETEMAEAAYAHAFDEQMRGTRGIVALFPNCGRS